MYPTKSFLNKTDKANYIPIYQNKNNYYDTYNF